MIRDSRAIAILCAWLLLCVSLAYVVVGVNDSCPVPTPSPPPGAGWAAFNNAGMEGGFTDGVANQWIGWKDDTYTTQVHFVGDDRSYDGAYSQKLNLPQPPPDTAHQEDGIYQRVYVVVGGTYTVTVKLYLNFPPQGYNGEDLLAFLGVDPWGQESGDGYGMVWDEVSQQNQWVTAQVTVQAVMPVITVGVKGTRKWPMHGDGALVWIDALTITGPVPADPPPGPEPDPVDPETLVPATVGPNLVANPSFEDAYTAGVSAGWNKWSTAGTGAWKRSERMGKVGPGFYDCGNIEEVKYMNPKTVLFFSGNPFLNPDDIGSMGQIASLVAEPKFADTIIVGRPFIDTSLGDIFNTHTPTYWGREYGDRCKHLESLVPRVDCWQGLNEPGTDDPVIWQKGLEFEIAFAQRCHELGLKSCSLNLSTGSPGNIWRMIDESFSPSAHDLLGVADYFGHHVYGGPTDGLMVTSQVHDNACALALRPRRFKDMYDRRGWRFPPVIATEGSTFGPWHGAFSADQVADDCMLMGQYMNADRWWCGYTNFANGIQCNAAWTGWDMTNVRVADGRLMTEAIGEWNYNHPADTMDGLYSQMFGSGHVHPRTVGELTPDGDFSGGVNRQITSLVPGTSYVLKCWMKYEFRGHQPTALEFHLGVDPTGQTANGDAATIDWGDDQIADKAPIHEIFTHVWRTFTAQGAAASIWLRASQPMTDPSFRVYVDLVEVRELEEQPAAQTAPGFYQDGWNLTSVPIAPAVPDAGVVFQDLTAIGNVIAGNLYRYDPGLGYAMYPLAFSGVDRGRGYWLWLDVTHGDTVVSIEGAFATGDVPLPLAQGWTLIGHPFPQPAALSSCRVTDGATMLAFGDAVATGWVSGVLYSWDPVGGYHGVRTDPFGHDDALRPWYGYWVYAMMPGLQMVVPIP